MIPLSLGPQFRESSRNWILSSELCLNTDQISFDRELWFCPRCQDPEDKRALAANEKFKIQILKAFRIVNANLSRR